MEGITELINAGVFDTEMIEANAKIPNQIRTNADHYQSHLTR